MICDCDTFLRSTLGQADVATAAPSICCILLLMSIAIMLDRFDVCFMTVAQETLRRFGTVALKLREI